MKTVQTAPGPIEVGKSKSLLWPKIIIGFVVALVIFSLGVGVGSGRYRLGTHKPVAKNLPANLTYSSVESVYDKLRTDFDGQLDQNKLLDGLKAGLAQASGDPYTEYFNAQGAEDFNNELSGTFTGIGAELGKDANGNIVVMSPISGYPAEKVGLKPKDIIESVNGESTSGKTITEVVNKIRGPADTKVTLKIVRDNAQELTFEITRAEIKIPSVTSEVLDGNVGYIKVSRFSDDTTELAQKAADQFKQANVKGVILDLRYDPGGLLPTAVDVASLWLDENQVVLQEKRGGVVSKTYKGNGNAVLKGVPTVALVNDGSASASEIVAGALRDNNAATLIGKKTFGKGSVQQLEPLTDGGMLKVTIAHWFTPSGKGIDKEGITPDKQVERSDDDIKNNIDPQKDAAIQQLKQ